MDALELARAIAKQNSATVYLLTVIAIPPAGATALPPVPIFPNLEFEAETVAVWKHWQRKSWPGCHMKPFSRAGAPRWRFFASPPNEVST